MEGTKSSPPWFKWIVYSAYVTEAKVVNSQFLTLAFSHWSHAPQWWCGWYWINSAKNSTPYWDTMKMFKMLSNCTDDTRNDISEKNENASIWKNVKVWNRVEVILFKWDDNSKPNKLSLSLWFWYFPVKDFNTLEIFCSSEKWEGSYLHLHVKYNPVPIYNGLYSSSAQG